MPCREEMKKEIRYCLDTIDDMTLEQLYWFLILEISD